MKKLKNAYTNREKKLIRFFNKYENLTLKERTLKACEHNGQPYSWNVIFLEIINKTKYSLDLLDSIKI